MKENANIIAWSIIVIGLFLCLWLGYLSPVETLTGAGLVSASAGIVERRRRIKKATKAEVEIENAAEEIEKIESDSGGLDDPGNHSAAGSIARERLERLRAKRK